MTWPAEAAPDVIRVLALDPGTTTLGCGIIEIPIDNLECPRVVWARTLHVKNKTHLSSTAEIDGERAERLNELEEELVEVIKMTLPTFFATETPFMKRGKMSAYESGIELQVMIRQAVRRVSMTLAINGFNPMMVKHFVGVDHIKTPKLAVQEAVRDLYKGRSDIDIMALDEHSSDSLAVAHTFYRKEMMGLGPIFIRQKKPKGAFVPRRHRRRKKKQ